jgi:hypothetical protein
VSVLPVECERERVYQPMMKSKGAGMNKYSVRVGPAGPAGSWPVYVAVDDLPVVHFATAQNEVDARAIADALQAREQWRLDAVERSAVELADPCYDCGALSAGSAGRCYTCPLARVG